MSGDPAGLPKEKQTVLGLYLTAREAYARCLAEPGLVNRQRPHPGGAPLRRPRPLAWNIPAFAQGRPEWDAGKGKFP